MKKVKSKTGEVEMQTPEYLPDGPVLLPETAPDVRPMINRSDGTPSTKAPERPVYVHPGDRETARAHERIAVLESQIKSLQIAIGTIERRLAPPIEHPAKR